MAGLTNLIPQNEQINDIYTHFQIEILKYIKDNFNLSPKTYKGVCTYLTRKLVKSLIMPMVYGKTLHTMSIDIYNHMDSLLTKRECFEIALIIMNLFRNQFHNLVQLMDLIRYTGWLAAAMNRPVFYSIDTLTTAQDYMKSGVVKIWVYDRILRKRRQVTLRIPTHERDLRKTTAATFANFIHQKDAWIAMFMIDRVINELGAPIYTVHDNFITTAPFAFKLPEIYIQAFKKGWSPLYYINLFIIHNLCRHKVYARPYDEPIPLDELKYMLDSCQPFGPFNKQKIEMWDKKKKIVYDAYYYLFFSQINDEYNIVGINQDLNTLSSENFWNFVEINQEKYREFITKIGPTNPYSHNYALHL